MSRLPFPFIFTGILGFILYQVTSLLSFSSWLGAGVRSMEGWFHAHLFILGWATMLAMGAVYQLTHVILQRNIASKTLGYIQYAIFTVGLIGLLYGFIRAEFQILAIFASLALIGILLFAANIIITMWKAGRWDAITISALCAVLYLVLTGLSGLAMGVNFATGIFGHIHQQLFGAHIWMGFIGWFGLLITGFSYKMLPMFYLAHDYPVKLQMVVLILWNAAVLVGAVAFLSGAGSGMLWFALALLAAAVIVYNVHLMQIKKHRHKKNPGNGIRWSVISSQALAVAAVATIVMTALVPSLLHDTEAIVTAGWMYLGCWVSFTILSYASKIVPFLWWTYRYGSLAGKPGTPLMANLLSDRYVQLGLSILAVMSLLVLIAIPSSSATFIALAGSALAVGSVLYMVLIGFVFLR